MNEKHLELSWGMLRYSKRIILVSLFTWVGIVIAVLIFLVMSGLRIFEIDDFITQVLKAILSSSATVTIALGCAYYWHSNQDEKNKLLQFAKTAMNNTNESNTSVSNG